MKETEQEIFDATLQREGSFTFVAIPFSPREVWGVKPRYYVTGTINDVSVRGTVGALGSEYFLRLGAAWMCDSGIEPGAQRLPIARRPQDTPAADVWDRRFTADCMFEHFPHAS